ncbi:MAG TPA: toast rack family protein [Caldilineaceae bacterium]|nr:toast rack family protein [Caldilineaceae bacterium]
MSRRVLIALLLLASIVLALVWAGVHMSYAYVRQETVATGAVRQEAIAVPRGGAERLAVAIAMSGDALHISGGAAHLLDGYIATNSDWLFPIIHYTESGRLGILTLAHRDLAELGRLADTAAHTATWDIQLNSSLPIANLDVAVGAEQATLDLRDMELQAARVDMIGGDLVVNLAQSWDHNVDVRLTGISGALTVYLPAEMGVMVYAEQAFGQVATTGLRPLSGEAGRYANAAYRQTPATLTISADMALGNIRLAVE